MWGGPASILRLFRAEFGGEISWLLPAALISLAALVWVSLRAPRTSRTRAFALIWGGWLIVTGLVFSYMQGIIHPYYMVALAPAIGALTGIGAAALWERNLGWAGRACAALAVAVTGVWAYVLLNRTPQWLPWLRWVILLAGIGGAAWLLLAPLTRPWLRRGLALTAVSVGFAVIAGLGGPVAYALEVANSTHTGSIPTAGPSDGGGFGGFGGPGGSGRPGSTGRPGSAGGTGGSGSAGGFNPGGSSAGSSNPNAIPGGAPGGTTSTGGNGAPSGNGVPGGSSSGSSAGSNTSPARNGFPGRAGAPGGVGGPGGFGGAGSGGGLSGNTQVSSALTKLLEKNASKYTWIAATIGSQEAAPIELATGGDAVMAIGGFNGTDNTPTLAQFKSLVAKHEIHYFLGRNTQAFGGGNGSSAISSWVASHFKSQTVGGTTVYDLTQPK